MTDEMCGSTNSPLAPSASMESFTTTTSRIDRGKVFKRKKKPSRKLRDTLDRHHCHWRKTFPGSVVAWSSAPVPAPCLSMDKVKAEAKRRKIELLILPTAAAIEEIKRKPDQTNAILHLTC